MLGQDKPSYPVYAGLVMNKDFSFYIAIKYGKKMHVEKMVKKGPIKPQDVLDWLCDFSRNQKIKFIGLGYAGIDRPESFGSALWLKKDIVPYDFNHLKGKSKNKAKKIANRVSGDFDKKENLVKINFDKDNRVRPAFLTSLKEYKKYDAPYFKELEKLAEEFKQRKLKVTFFNSTAAGGGVALMRHALMRLYNLLGVNAEWYVTKSKGGAIFDITKRKIHNILQGVAPAYVKLTEQDKEVYKKWTRENAKFFKKKFKESDVVVIDDPQPAGLIPYIKKENPSAKIIYRSHIQVEASLIDQKQEQQYITWSFIWSYAQQADLFVSHPIDKFVPQEVPRDKVVYMPATTDILDGLNKPLKFEQKKHSFEVFNKILRENGQTPLDLNRPYIIQIARFDPSKGIPHVLDSYKKLYHKMIESGFPKAKIPQLVIAGNGAIDDPEGAPILSETLGFLTMDDYKDLADDIKVTKLPHYDQILNTLLRESKVVLQLSLKEGFEVKVTEALAKGKPVIAYNTGGIPLQIRHGKSGYLVEPGNTTEVAERLYELFRDRNKYREMSDQAARLVRKDCFTVANAYNWLRLAKQLLD